MLSKTRGPPAPPVLLHSLEPLGDRFWLFGKSGGKYNAAGVEQYAHSNC